MRRMMSKDKIEVLTLTAVRGTAMSARRDYNNVRDTLNCRIMPIGTTEAEIQLKRTYDATHEIRFPDDPQLALTDRLRDPTNGMILRLCPGFNPHRMNWFWIVLAKAHQEDNTSLKELT